MPVLAGSAMSVSVVVPCYNYGRFLEPAVRSVLDQPGVDVDVLIIDDASSDSTAEVAADLAGRDPRVTVVHHHSNLGHIATYNEGLDRARGECVVLLSADDLLTPGALGRAAEVFRSHPDVGLVYGGAVVFDDGDPPPRARAGTGRPQVWSGRRWVETRCRLGRAWIYSPEAVVRTAVQRAVGGYRSDLPHTADLEMWIRVAMRTDVACLPADQAYRRMHGRNMSTSRFGAAVVDCGARKAAFDSLLGDGDRGGAALHRLAMRGLARDAMWQACREHDRGADGPSEADGLLAFAVSADGGARTLGEYRGLRRRRWMGARLCRLAAPLIAPALALRRVRRLRLQYGGLWWRQLVSL